MNARQMRAVLAPLFLLSLLISSASAGVTRYVRSDGRDFHTGANNAGSSDSSGAWQTIAKANATADSGDRIVIVSLIAADTLGADTSHVIRPIRNGTALNPIVFVGNQANPVSIGMSYLRLQMKYVSVKWIRFRGPIEFWYADEAHKAVGDTTLGTRSYSIGYFMAKKCFADSFQVVNPLASGSVAFLSNDYIAGPPYDPVRNPSGPANCKGDPFGNVLQNGRVDAGAVSSPGQLKMFVMRYAHEDTVRRVNFRWQFTGVDGDCQGRYIYNSQDCLIEDCSWTAEADWYTYQCPSDSSKCTNCVPCTDGLTTAHYGADWTAFAMRDSAIRITFRRDSTALGLVGGKPIGGRIANTGNSAWTAASRDCRWLDCRYLTTGGTWSQVPPNNFQFIGSVFEATLDRGLELPNGTGIAINHCTIGGRGNQNFGSAFAFTDPTGFSSSSVTSNIFHSDSTYTPGLGAGGNYYEKGIAYFNTYSSSNLINNNVYWAPKQRVAGTGPTHAVAAPGSNGMSVGPLSSWCTADQKDCNSRWGTPAFRDSVTTAATFDPTLQTGSFAAWSGFPDGYAGAIALPDTTPPDSATVSVAAASPCPFVDAGLNHRLFQVQVQWTTPGDDGAVGQVDSLHLAVSFNQTETPLPVAANFGSYRVNSATVTGATTSRLGCYAVLLPPEITPGAPGEVQTATLTFDTLTLATPIKIRITLRAKDSSGNASYGHGVIDVPSD